MNRLQKKIFFLFLLFQATAHSQNDWTLEACINYAVQHNLKINDLQYNTHSTKESHRQSYRSLLPSVSANASYFIQYGRSTDPNSNQITNTDFFSNNYSINASIDLFQGFQKLNEIAATKFLYRASKEVSLQEKYLLAFRVMSAFYDVQFFEELIQISKEQVKISQNNYNLVTKQIELGLKAGADKYEAASVLIGDKLIVTQNENKLKAAKLTLLQEMNLENSTDISIQTSDITMLQKSILQQIAADSIYQKALSFIPSIKAQELRVNAAKKDIGIARANLYPSLTLSAGYGTGFFETNVDATGKVIPFSTQIKDNASQFIGLSLRIPISGRWSSRSQIKQQKIALLKSKNNLALQKQELNKLIQELVQSYNASAIEYEQTQKNEAFRSVAFTVAQKKYDKGMISILELYRSKNLYAKAQSENLQVKMRLEVQKKTIDFYRGIAVFNINTITQ
ncbi:MAG TPA: TolC family protein [Flavobacteriia bacterium]|nr:TolC family protein [Flavobacteriia bacterium]